MLTAFAMVWVTLSGLSGQGPPPRSAAVVQAVGVGYPPPRLPTAQGRLMARRAAEVAAVRNLAGKLGVGSQGRLSTFRYILTKELPNGAVEVTVESSVLVGAMPTRGTTAKSAVRPRRPVGGRP